MAVHGDNCEQGSLFLFGHRLLGVDFISFHFYIKDIEVDVFLKILLKSSGGEELASVTSRTERLTGTVPLWYPVVSSWPQRTRLIGSFEILREVNLHLD